MGTSLDTMKNIWRKFHLTQVFILLLSICILLLLGFVIYFMKSADVESLKKGLSQQTIIYDKDGDVASKLSANRSDSVPIKKIPDSLQDAVVAIEDHQFYNHNGFYLKGMLRAFVQDILHGGAVQGGSTITQQLTKNALLSPEKTLKRKIEELFLAIQIEKVYKKKEILEMYLNTIYFGQGAWGVQNASEKYFGKNVQDLNLSESALLAGLIKAPSALDPYNHYDAAIKRRNVVLDQMVKYGYITQEEANKAKSTTIVLKDGSKDPLKEKYPYFGDAVIEEAVNRYGLSQKDLLEKGYKIYTTMDQNIQSQLEKVYKEDWLFPKGVHGGDVQSAVVMLDPHNGGVLGVVGSRGEHVFRGFSYATQMKTSPGSTIKPLAVYTPALEEGYQPTSMLKDEKMKFGDYEPSNYDGVYKGEVPMYEAVEKSLNVPAVWLLNEIGLDKGVDALKRFGIPLEKEDRNLSIALGGMYKGVSPLQMASAYSTFANGGVRQEGHFIRKIVDPDGKVVAEWKGEGKRVTSKKVVDEMNSMLLNVVAEGTGRKASIPGYKIAGKTGSTQVPIEGVDGTKDQWFIGYTPNVVGAVWLGFDNNNDYLTSNSSDGVVPVFREVMEKTLPYIKNESFDVTPIQKQVEKKKKKDWKEKLIEEWKKLF